jgi:iron(III) transport system permease protein
LAVVALVVSASPLVYLYVRLTEFGVDKVFAQVFRGRSIELLANSILLTVAVSISALLIGSFQAWLTVRTSVRGRTALAISSALPLAMPSYVAAYAFSATSSDFKGFWAAWLVLTIGTAPYVYLAVSAALIRSDSATEEVARSLGYSRWLVFKNVTWPTIRPSAIGGAMLAALYTLSDFGAVSILNFDTFTRAIYNAYRSSFDRSAAASLAGILVLITLLILLVEPRLRGRLTQIDSRVRKNTMISLGKFGPVAGLAASIWSFIGLVIPGSSLISWNLVGLSEVDLSEVLRALTNSVGYSIAGGLITAVFGLAISVLTVRHPSKFSGGIEKTVWLTHAVPGIVVALSLVFISNRLVPWLYQTSALVLVAYLILFIPNAMAAMKTPVSQVPKSMDEVAASLGSGRLDNLRRVLIPIAGPGILTGAALVALSILKELPATLMLRETGMETLATRLWSETSVSAFGAAAPYALILVLVAGIPAWLLNRQVRMSIGTGLSEEQRLERE